MGLLLPIMLLAAFGNQIRNQANAYSVPSAADVTSTDVTEPLGMARKRLASLGGRKSTLLTGGLLGTPSLIKQGLGL